MATKFTATHAGIIFKRSSAKAYTHAVISIETRESLKRWYSDETIAKWSPDLIVGDRYFYRYANWASSLELAQKRAAQLRKTSAEVVILPAVQS